MIIRKANYSDLNKIYSLMDDIKDNTKDEWFFKDDREYVYNHIEKDGFILVAEDDDIVAYLMIHYVDYDKDVGLYHVAYMDSVGVYTRARGHSLMKRLVIKAEEILEDSYKYFMATVHPDNIYSLRVFESLGYQRVKILKKYNHLQRYLLLKNED